MKRVLIMAGGTGGHIFPAMAVAETLQAEGYAVSWLGANRGMEKELVPKAGYDFQGLAVSAWQGGGLVRKVKAPINLVSALWQALGILKRLKPVAVIGFGGYASAPGGLAAILCRVPLVLHEQNGVPGLTNARLAKRADRVLQAFPDTFSGEVEVVGNPVREALRSLPEPAKRGVGGHRRLRLLVMGGSQGAKALNEVIGPAVATMTTGNQPEIWHQAGRDKVEPTLAVYRQSGVEASVVEFVDDMAKAYGWADLVICRSGASTVSELASVGLYSLLVPYPWHKDRQQYRNAQWLVDCQGAEVIDQNELTAERLGQRLAYWHSHRDALKSGATAAWRCGIRDSAQRVVRVVNELILEQAA
ncbi:undecaprenyldiphospho-muramoylpentapeptide beta-N-acetylglucosaminyltransferase [Saccharospirillum salsuginis]|uniref:UDP-N-acetylglucosamine--N-acetylmuramyl-(pentapeptide) pyrophosphoryl-undecaprenol N-acetylglucosamine transferase n=1 Tax=Saccharospirillum salsuginis TaxID=418750 RepID=A0A918K4X4_9GAMM|nr:undecaprenyldiphospho-muramoylpentapeptide beta-N-acetylglucosaminyltransferase [Saccharospirillum salsuginis]GGX46695.1 UDP-N-acetylglucosamine--N-acetylmuramyl-(pentapeptide) pyrophosphoryl-undecaprenol N-acetylglucosamine transferase [Saccharospirillum salsuginis]